MVPSKAAGNQMGTGWDQMGTKWEPKRESKFRWFPARLLGTKWELLSRFPAPQKRPMNTTNLGLCGFDLADEGGLTPGSQIAGHQIRHSLIARDPSAALLVIGEQINLAV